MSGWSPKYFPEAFIRYANSILKKMLFGSDWPAITPGRWLAYFAAAPIKDEVRPLILEDNAERFLGLAG
jgi:predicted TIM-barrel fold metal-dependent hydrolase